MAPASTTASGRSKRSLAAAAAGSEAPAVATPPAKRTRRAKVAAGTAKEENAEGSIKEELSADSVAVEALPVTVPPTPSPSKSQQSATDRKLAIYRASKSTEPFPQWPHPTPQEAQAVAETLGKFHGHAELPRYRRPEERDTFGGCGATPSILDATIRTVLSCNTSSRNSTAAHKSLVARFGRMQWQAILDAPESDLVDAIRCGGLANNKARTIRGILTDTQERFGVLSLDHLHSAPDAEIMETLLSFRGIGPKVVSCVLAFCIGREHMAVDTHVARLSIALGWVPTPKATRDQIYYHLHERVPPALKYPLHVLLVKHGKRCAECSAKGFATEKDDIVGSDADADDDVEEKKNRPCPLRAAGLLGKKGKKSIKREVEVEDKEGLKLQIDAGLDQPASDVKPPLSVKKERRSPPAPRVEKEPNSQSSPARRSSARALSRPSS